MIRISQANSRGMYTSGWTSPAFFVLLPQNFEAHAAGAITEFFVPYLEGQILVNHFCVPQNLLRPIVLTANDVAFKPGGERMRYSLESYRLHT